MASKKKPSTQYAWIERDLWPLARSIAELPPDASNARLHEPHQIEMLRVSLERFRQRKNVVVQVRPDGTRRVIAGNGTLAAAHALGWSHVAAIEVEEDDGAADAYAVADNRIPELATWDDDRLRELLAADVGLVGFGEGDVAALLGGGHTVRSSVSIPALPPDEREEIESAAAPDVVAASSAGVVYQLGPHRLLCGDSTRPEALEALGVSADDPASVALQVVDPPFDMAYDSWPIGLSDRVWLWGAGAQWIATLAAHLAAGYGSAEFALIGQTKSQASEHLPCRQHEIATIFGRPLSKPNEEILRSIRWPMTTGARPVSWARGFSWHSGGRHSKPVRAMMLGMAYAIGDGPVLDLTAGGGSSLIAAARVGRTWRGAEMDPVRVDAIRRRWTRWARERGVDPGEGALYADSGDHPTATAAAASDTRARPRRARRSPAPSSPPRPA